MKKILLSSLFMIFFVGCSKAPVITPNSNFEVKKYLGKWYEIKRFDHTFEKGLKNVEANYSFISNNKIKVYNVGIDNQGNKKTFSATGKIQSFPNFLKVYPDFFPFIGGQYNIAWIDKNYRYAIVTSSSYNYLWFLSREKEIPKTTYDEMISFSSSLGFDTSKLINGQ